MRKYPDATLADLAQSLHMHVVGLLCTHTGLAQTGRMHSPAKAQTCTFMCLSSFVQSLQEPRSVLVQLVASGTA